MAIEQAAEKRVFFIGCSEGREDLVGVWETMSVEPKCVGNEWESVYRRKQIKCE